MVGEDRQVAMSLSGFINTKETQPIAAITSLSATERFLPRADTRPETLSDICRTPKPPPPGRGFLRNL